MPGDCERGTQAVLMKTGPRRVSAVTVALVALAAGAWLGERDQERQRTDAGERARADAQRATDEVRAALERWSERVRVSAQTAASLEPLVKLVQHSVDEKTFQDFVDTEEAWEPFRGGAGATALVLGERLVASTGRAELVASASELAPDAAAHASASGLVALPIPQVVGAARMAKASPIGLAAVVVLSRPLEAEALGELAQKLDVTLALAPARGALMVAGPEAAALEAFHRSGAWASACCGRRALARDLQLVVLADPSITLAQGERSGASSLKRWLFAAAGLASLLLVLGFRREGAAGGEVALLAPPPPSAPRPERPELRLLQGGEPVAEGGDPPELGRTQTSKTPSRYQVISQLGEGGMSRVYVAFTTGAEGFHRQFVLKRLREELSANAEAVNQFIDEARLGASMVHSNVVPVYDFGRDDEGYFIAQEYILGRDVEALVAASLSREGRPLEPRVVLYLLRETLRALAYAHSKCDDAGEWLELVHRDVSPRNLLVSARGEVKLLDFGLVKSAQRLSQTQAGFVKGNLYFMSPEQARALPLDARGDLFSLGQTLYFAATGETLYAGATQLEMLNRAAAGLTATDWVKVRALAEPLPELLERALATMPGERFVSADAWLDVVPGSAIASASEVQALMERLFQQELSAEQGRFSARGP